MTGDPTPSERGDDAVLRYLAAIETRRTAPETLPKPDAAAETLGNFSPPEEEERPDLAAEVGQWTPGAEANLARLEDGFVESAADYGERHGIDYQGWRNAGVPEEVLDRAGIVPG